MRFNHRKGLRLIRWIFLWENLQVAAHCSGLSAVAFTQGLEVSDEKK